MTLPTGWARATIVEVGQTKLGKMLDAVKNKGVFVPYIRNINVRWGGFDLSDLQEMKVTTDELRELSVRNGDLFICEGGEPGRCAVWRGGSRRLVFQKAIHRIRPSEGIESIYLGYYIKYMAVIDEISNFLTGTTIRHLPQVSLEKIEVPVPPTAEQLRIIAKLDALTACLARARVELNRVAMLARSLKQAALSKAFDRAVKADWPNLGSVLEAIDAGKNLKCEERPPTSSEFGVVKVSAVSAEKFRPTEAKTLPRHYVPPAKDKIHNGDLLIARASGSLTLVGRVALVQEEPKNLYLSDKVLRLRLRGNLGRWCYWFLRSPVGREQIEDAASGISMHNITQSSVGALKLPLPGEGVRRERIEKIETTFARANRLEAEAARAHALLDRLVH